jgi:hypothetical protein
MRALAVQTGTTQDISANIALKAALDAYGISSEFWHTGGGCTARYVTFGPGWEVSEHQLHIAITDDASVDHPIAHHNGWLAMWWPTTAPAARAPSATGSTAPPPSGSATR